MDDPELEYTEPEEYTDPVLALDVVDVVRERRAGAAGVATDADLALLPNVPVDLVRTRENAALTSVDLGSRARGTVIPTELGVEGIDNEFAVGGMPTAIDWARARETG